MDKLNFSARMVAWRASSLAYWVAWWAVACFGWFVYCVATSTSAVEASAYVERAGHQFGMACVCFAVAWVLIGRRPWTLFAVVRQPSGS